MTYFNVKLFVLFVNTRQGLWRLGLLVVDLRENLMSVRIVIDFWRDPFTTANQ
jgi:hypothetical protein